MALNKTMSLAETIKADIKTAMLAKNAERVATLRMLAAAASNKQTEKRAKIAKAGETSEEKLIELSKLTDEEMLEVISSEAKKRKDAIGQFEQGGRPELAEGEKKELQILTEYLPAQMGEDELKKIVEAAVKELNASGLRDMGKVMGAVMPKVKGKADGEMVKKIAQQILG